MSTMSSFLQECAWLYRHKGVLVILIVAPLTYSLFYPLPYEHAVVDDVPMIVWDNENSVDTREWIHKLDATPQLKVIAVLPGEPNEADWAAYPEAQFFSHFPADTSERIGLQQQVTIPYGGKTDNFLVYSTAAKAFTLTIQAINKDIRLGVFYSLEGNSVSAEAMANPISVNITQLFNPEASYLQYLVPAVFIVMVHQILVMGIGMHWGYRFEMNRPVGHPFGVWVTHLVLYSLIGLALITFFFRLMLPRQSIFFTGNGLAFLDVSLPFVLGAVGFAMTFTAFFREQETALVWSLPISVPLLMISGVSWPELGMADWLVYVSQWLPSTWGINALLDVAYLNHRPDLTEGWRNAFIWLSLGLLLRFVVVGRWQEKHRSTGETPA
ncbi:ABC transporter permease [Reinekea marinisedimentorum]|uniref:ABC-2 family transporter n=1 Tax=Reinekea marinisedimentorum TaxID=230495 RepID=A0A4R3I1Y4_9GAMM|nr:ABC transporter permease [Reinekea marinisedimentorum]TCS38741.1 ABC-2 family transporter [Reinekea marinisedimentorum]